MMIREPAQAGTFYAGAADQCRRDLEAIFNVASAEDAPAGVPIGGIVPHAGWMYSGRVAARVYDVIGRHQSPTTVIIFGAVHRPIRPAAAIFARGAWSTPLGDITIDERLADRLLSSTNLIEEDPYAHEAEHSIEVQVPLIQHRFPSAKLVPIMVRVADEAVEVGRAVGRTVAAYQHDAVFIGSTDLTHYGRRFGFAPQGIGAAGREWAKTVNDRRAIDCMVSMQSDAIVSECRTHANACGAGAIAATIAASQHLGATRGVLLEHTTSADVAPTLSSDDASVGYAGIVFVGDGA